MQTISKTKDATTYKHLAKILLGLSLTIVLLASMLSMYLMQTTKQTPNLTSHMTVKQDPKIITDNPDAITVRTMGKDYMKAALQGQYGQLWSMLHPEVQTLWHDQGTYTTFWQGHFQDYDLQGFQLGKVLLQPTWTNPETMIQYNNVLLLQVSLQLKLKASLQQSTLPPEVLNPTSLFQNLPFIVQHAPGDKWFVLDGGPFDLEAPILPPTKPVTTTLQVPIPMFHHIADVTTDTALAASLQVNTALFSQQMDYLKAQGYHTITFNQLFNGLYYKGPLPTKPIILTFDDGYDDAYKYAYPILKAHGFTGMFYIISGKVGWGGQMTWGQMREMLTNGMQMGSHTVNHVDMGQTLAESLDLAQQELQVSQSTLQRNLHIPIQQFCYPSGEPFRHGTVTQQQEIVQLLAQDGYIGATTDPGATGIVQDNTAPFVLLRIRVDGRYSLQVFKDSMPW